MDLSRTSFSKPSFWTHFTSRWLILTWCLFLPVMPSWDLLSYGGCLIFPFTPEEPLILSTVRHPIPDSIPSTVMQRDIRVSWLNPFTQSWSFQQIKNTLGKPDPCLSSPKHKTWMRWWERKPDKGNQTPAGCDLFVRSQDSWVYTCTPQWEVEVVFCLMWVKKHKHNTVSYHNLVFEQSLYVINAYETSKSAVFMTGAELDWQRCIWLRVNPAFPLMQSLEAEKLQTWQNRDACICIIDYIWDIDCIWTNNTS